MQKIDAKSRLKGLIVFVLIIFSFNTIQAEKESITPEEIIENMKKTKQEIKDFKGTLRVTRFKKLLEKEKYEKTSEMEFNIITKGTNKMWCETRYMYLNPKHHDIADDIDLQTLDSFSYLNNGILWTCIPEKKEVVKMTLPDNTSDQWPCMNGHINRILAFTKSCDLDIVAETKDMYILSAITKKRKCVIQINKKDWLPYKFEFWLEKRTRQKEIWKNIKINSGVKDSTFVFELPKGWKIVKHSSEDTSKSSEEKKISSDNEAPDFTLRDLANEKISLSNFRGNVVLLDFWATWCGPCQKTMPHLQELHKKYEDKGLVVIGVNVDKDMGKVKRFIRENNYTFKILTDPRGWQSKAISLYNVRGIPATFLIDKQGIIRFQGHPLNLKETLIQELLSQ